LFDFVENSSFLKPLDLLFSDLNNPTYFPNAEFNEMIEEELAEYSTYIFPEQLPTDEEIMDALEVIESIDDLTVPATEAFYPNAFNIILDDEDQNVFVDERLDLDFSAIVLDAHAIAKN